METEQVRLGSSAGQVVGLRIYEQEVVMLEYCMFIGHSFKLINLFYVFEAARYTPIYSIYNGVHIHYDI
jgi:hypothetical protein